MPISTPTFTRSQLTDALFGNGCLKIHGKAVLLISAEREDGSGRSFNLTVSDELGTRRIFVRIND